MFYCYFVGGEFFGEGEFGGVCFDVCYVVDGIDLENLIYVMYVEGEDGMFFVY